MSYTNQQCKNHLNEEILDNEVYYNKGSGIGPLEPREDIIQIDHADCIVKHSQGHIGACKYSPELPV